MTVGIIEDSCKTARVYDLKWLGGDMCWGVVRGEKYSDSHHSNSFILCHLIISLDQEISIKHIIVKCFQGQNADIVLEDDFVTTPDLQERYKLLSENHHNRSGIRKREVQQRQSTIELAIFTDRSEDKTLGFVVQTSFVGRFTNMLSNAIQM